MNSNRLLGNTLLLCACILRLLGQPGFGASAIPEHKSIAGASPEPSQASGPASAEELEAFVDGLINLEMRTKPIVGAALVVVKGDKVLLMKGYGSADLDKRIPIEPAKTIFRAGSVSKLFTWTAVMQLVEQGKVDLDADVNSYLKDLQLPRSQYPPVTLRNLMTHSAGFEEGFLGYLMPANDRGYLSFGEYLRAHMPERARPPATNFADGTLSAYSNWGATLAGHIVESVSGEQFDDYIDRHILQPLRMTSSSFREPLPGALTTRMAKGYEVADGAPRAHEFERWHNTAPAASLSATVADMANFMRAHLQQGQFGGAQILSPESTRMMHARALSPDPAVNAMALGFEESWMNGHRVIGHGGSVFYFHTQLALVPEADLGLFVAFNSAEAGSSGTDIQRAFMDHYFPANLPAVKPAADAAKQAQKYLGTYRILRRSYTKVEKAFAATSDFDVNLAPDGALLMAHPLVGYGSESGALRRWVEVGQGVFREEGTDDFIAFKTNLAGGMSIVGVDPSHPFERVAWYVSAKLHGFILTVAVVLLLCTFVSAIRRRHSGVITVPALKWAWAVLGLAGILLTAFVLGLVVVVSGGLMVFASGIPAMLYATLTLPLLMIPLTLAAAYFTVIIWWRSIWALRTRLYYTAAALSACLCLFVLNYWNLVGYHFG